MKFEYENVELLSKEIKTHARIGLSTIGMLASGSCDAMGECVRSTISTRRIKPTAVMFNILDGIENNKSHK